jgi:hypothetical protein
MKNCKTREHQITRSIPRIACVASVAMAFTLALPQTARAQTVTPPPVPPGLEVPAPSEAILLGRGVGTQNYECQPTSPLGRVGWVLFTPQATLFDDDGGQLITHFSSPNPDEVALCASAGKILEIRAQSGPRQSLPPPSIRTRFPGSS